MYDSKVQAVFDHIATAYGDDGRRVYDGPLVEPLTPAGGVATVPADRSAREDAIVKTVAAFLNTDGGTLLIGTGPDRAVVGLADDYGRVKPNNGDGFVNWLTTHLLNALGHTPVTRTRARIAMHEGTEICRVDVAASPAPVWAKTSKEAQVFFVRLNNSTRALPDDEQLEYTASRWPGG